MDDKTCRVKVEVYVLMILAISLGHLTRIEMWQVRIIIRIMQFHGQCTNSFRINNLIHLSHLSWHQQVDLEADMINSLCFKTRLIVQVQVVKVSICPKMLCVPVQREVDISSVAFNHHSVPVTVIQEAASGDGGVTHDGAILVTACNDEWLQIRSYTIKHKHCLLS